MVDWSIVVSVMVALALFLVGVAIIGGTACMLMMQVMFKRMANSHKCPVPGCPFAKAMEANWSRATVEEPEAEEVAV